MAEAVLAGEEVKEFPLGKGFCAATYFLAILSRLTEDFLMGDGPSDAGNGNGDEEKVKYLG